MQETIVNFQTALLAKERGFDWEVFLYYINSGELCPEEEILYCIKKGSFLNNNFNEFGEDYYSFKDVLEEHISAPSQSLLQKWLRKKKILVEVQPIHDWNNWTYKITIEDLMSAFCQLEPTLEEFYSYEEALEVGLQQALDLL